MRRGWGWQRILEVIVADVAIVGAGSVGQALAARLQAVGVPVRFGVRSPAADQPGGVTTLDVREAVRGADLVLLAVPAAAAVSAASAAGDLRGKVLVDCTNPLRWEGGPVWNPPAEGSVTAALAAALPGVPVVKGFNHFGAEIQRWPALATGPADALFAGDDASAKQRVMALAARMGFAPHDAGPLRNAALLENLAVLWIHLATTEAGRDWAFTISRAAGATGATGDR